MGNYCLSCFVFYFLQVYGPSHKQGSFTVYLQKINNKANLPQYGLNKLVKKILIMAR